MTAEKFSNANLRFQACLAFTLKFEGGKSHDPRDPGGRTMEGVTQATYDAYRVKKALGRRDVFTIEAAERDEIYRNEYWHAVDGDILRAGEDLCVFDFAVNSGPVRALKVLRLRRQGPIDEAIHGICTYRLSFLHALRTWSHFGLGWGRRVAACEALAIRMAHGKGAPMVLGRKADAANAHSGKKWTQAVVAGTVTGTAAIAHALHGGMNGVSGVLVALATASFIGVLAFHAWRHAQRASAFVTEAKR